MPSTAQHQRLVMHSENGEQGPSAMHLNIAHATSMYRIELRKPLALLIGALMLLVLNDAHAESNQSEPIERDCFWQLTKGNSNRIKCDFPVRMTPDELKKVQELTRGVLTNAECNMVVDIERKLIEEAMHTPDHIFEPPAQPVSCDINTTKKDFTLEFFFKPRVIFKEGQAIEATPGMGAETRATRVISWPVRKWVNSSDEIEDAMVRIINAYLKQYRK